MITVTDAAARALDEFFAGRERGGIRIYLAPGSADGPHLALVMDEAGEEDRVEEAAGCTFCMHERLAAQVGSVLLDCVDDEFVLRPGTPFSRPVGGCAGCRGGSCGSCGQ